MSRKTSDPQAASLNIEIDDRYGVGDNILTIVDVPEKKITLFAMRLALLEKTANRLGTLTFVWATAVLLGGFTLTLGPMDFWFVTVILVFEGTRIFCRSHELEWHNNISMETHSHTISPLGRTLSTASVELVPFSGWTFVAKNVNSCFFIMQTLLALTCVVLSLSRLISHNYGKSNEGSQDNRVFAIIIFYAMTFLEALLFILEKVAFHSEIVRKRLFTVVSEEFGFDESFGPQAVRRFFYDAYGKAINDSIFQSLKMDFVTFGMDLLMQSSPDTQAHLTGASILRSLIINDRFKEDALRVLGTTRDVMEKLIEVLCWKSPEEQQIRREAAQIILYLVRKKRNCVRVAAIEGCFEAVSSLLYDDQALIQYRDTEDLVFYNYIGFTVIGLKILNNLAKDADNCSKIAGTRGLLIKIVNTVRTEEYEISSEFSKGVVEESLELLNGLASSSSVTGKQLRKGILENVSTISNIRNVIMRFGDDPKIQRLAIQTLSSLALEKKGREIIGATGRVLNMLVNVVFDDSIDMELANKAGEAVWRLTIDNRQNCRTVRGICKGGNVEKLLDMLGDLERGIYAARILRRLCIFMTEGEPDLHAVKRTIPKIVRIMMNAEGVIRQESIIGLGAYCLKFLDHLELSEALTECGFNTEELISKMIEVLKTHKWPSTEAPCIRRFCLMVLSLLCERHKDWGDAKVKGNLREVLEETLETTSEIESYCTFSGSVGLNRYIMSIRDLVCSVFDKFPECPFASVVVKDAYFCCK